MRSHIPAFAAVESASGVFIAWPSETARSAPNSSPPVATAVVRSATRSAGSSAAERAVLVASAMLAGTAASTTGVLELGS